MSLSRVLLFNQMMYKPCNIYRTEPKGVCDIHAKYTFELFMLTLFLFRDILKNMLLCKTSKYGHK